MDCPGGRRVNRPLVLGVVASTLVLMDCPGGQDDLDPVERLL